MGWTALTTDADEKAIRGSLGKDEQALKNEGYDSSAENEKKSLERDGKDTQDEIEQYERSLSIKEREQYINMRYTYSNRVFVYLCIYSIFCAFIILLQGLSVSGPACNYGGFYSPGSCVATFFHLNDAPLSVLIGSTAISAIGLVLAVIRGLYR